MDFKTYSNPIKLAFQFAKRSLRDMRTGQFFKLANPSQAVWTMPYSIELLQPVVSNAWLQNKLHNFRRAALPINAVTLKPGQVFSFWKTVGTPTSAKGYKTGRNLVNGQVQETIGGGLCQLSGIIYHTSLLAGLGILERHNHSVDLYANGEQRFTPLGADATVAFGYKDLRVANPFGFAVRFEVEVVGETLVCHLRSEKAIVPRELDFHSINRVETVEVTTLGRMEGGHLELLGRSFYKLPS